MKPNSLNIAVLYSLITLLLTTALAGAETAVQAWARDYYGLDTGFAYGKAVAVDSHDNVIVASTISGTGGRQDYDIATIKYSSNGIPLWTNVFDQPPGGQDDEVYAVAVDSADHILVCGRLYDANSGFLYVTFKFSPNGTLLWTNYECQGGYFVALDTNNNVIVSYPGTTKLSSGGATLWSKPIGGPVAVDTNSDIVTTAATTGWGGGYDYTTVKFSAAGGVLWSNRYNCPYNNQDNPIDIAVDSANNVIVTGRSTDQFGYWDYLTIKYSSGGAALWTNRWGAYYYTDDWGQAVKVDRHDNVIVTGYAGQRAYPYHYDYVTIKYSSAGDALWTNNYIGPNLGNDKSVDLCIDAADNIIVTGSSSTSEGSSIFDYLTIKYTSDGVALWTNRYNSPVDGADSVAAMTLDHHDNIILTGYTAPEAGSYCTTIKLMCLPEPVLRCLGRTAQGFKLRVDDVLQPGTLVIEAGTQLAGWQPVFTNTTRTNSVLYTDPAGSTAPMRFYRAFQFP